MDNEVVGLLDDGEVKEAQGASDSLADGIAVALMAEPAADGTLPREYLRKRMHLLDLEIRHFDEDYSLRRLGERLRIGIQVLLIVAGAVIVIALAALVWSAAHSQNVVVDAFDAPPDLAQKGETGRVVASDVLDELTKLQAATRTSAGKKSLKNAWTGDITINIPDTGISLGELERTLKDNLGNDLHIGGSLVETADGALALTVRGDGVLPKTFTGTDLPKLAQDAAEYVYGEAEPYLYSAFLNEAGRFDDSEKFLAQAYVKANDKDRPDLANSWGNALLTQGRTKEANVKYRLAVSLNPRFWKSWGNLIGGLALTEGEEAAYQAGIAMRARAAASSANDQPRPDDWENFDIVTQDWVGNFDILLNDTRNYSGVGVQGNIDGPAMADDAALMHDWQSVAQYLAASDPDDSVTRAEVDLVAGYHELERGNYADAIAPLEIFYKQWLADPNIRLADYDQPCFLGFAYAMTGRTADVGAVFQRTGRYVRCYGLRADGVDRSGNWQNAVVAYRASIALAPDLPFAYDRWGLALERRGDLNGASAAFREASRRGPHWAEPLKHWGDVLMRERRAGDAVAKYDMALKYAPRWDALQEAAASARTVH